MDYQLQEGSITLPEGFEDRTINMFISGSSIPAPLNITVSRDNLGPGEDLGAYLERQVTQIALRLPGYTALGSKAAQLSSTQPVAGLQVDGYHLKDGRPFYQRQAAFEIAPGRTLVFSVTNQTDFSKEQEQRWLQLLNSFEPRQVTAFDTVQG